MPNPNVSANPSASVKDRAGQLRSALAESAAGGRLIAELMPADIARAGKGTTLDFSDWSQFSQWPQSQ
jgi:hypothetical protein